MSPDTPEHQRELGELPLHPDEPGSADPETGPRRPGSVGAVVALLVLVGLLVVFFYWRPLPFPRGTPEQVTAAADAPEEPPVPAEYGPVPPLDESDEFVRALVRQLTSRPELLEWMASGNLVRTFVTAVDKVAIGSSPAREFRAAAPAGKFQTLGSGESLHIDPASYERYNTVANVVDAIDTEGAARAYRRLRPLFQQALDELGYTNLSFDERFAVALGRLVDVPVPDGDVRLRATSVTYQFADPELEALSPAQKHLLRMGPRNMRLIQSKIRAFARAAGLTQAGT
ncbi:MAG TPA: DUF3014 domain-containing protein [Vicinamibacterales bacterium]